MGSALSKERYRIHPTGIENTEPKAASPSSFQRPRMLGAEAREILVSNADDTGSPCWDIESSYGIVSLQRVLQRNQGGTYDAAISAIHIAPEAAFADDPFVVIGVQNRSAEALTNLELIVVTDSLAELYYNNFLPVGEI